MRYLTSTLLIVSLIVWAPPALMGQNDLGTVDFEPSCSSEVESNFERGLALLHHMMYEQAEGVFKAVADEDPSCAMVHWGRAMTQLHPLWAPPTKEEFQKGREAVVQAKAREAPTEREQAYIDAVAAYFEGAPERSHPERLAAWEEAQEQLHQDYPDDVDAGAFYALAHLSTAPSDDKTFTHQRRAGALLEELHAQHPKHPGLFHYTIHAYDNPALAEQAVEVARGYDDLAPDVPHALHMPSHIFVRLGMWPEVVDWNIRSAEAALEQPVGGKTSMHHAHALDYLMYAHLQQGQDEKAQEVLDEIKGVDDYQDHFVAAYALAAAPARHALEREAWTEAASLPARVQGGFPWDAYPQYEAITHFARGLGAARSGRLDAAREAVNRMGVLRDRTVENGEDYWAVQVEAKQMIVEAWISYAEDRPHEALDRMREAADLEDSVDKHPVTPSAVRPARELLGDLLVQLDRPKAAIDAYRAALEISPNRFNSLYGIGHAAEMAKKEEVATSAYTQLTQLSAESDAEREALARAKSFLAGN
ncbi:MAG: hypothetical protein GVY12_02455 [Bacteroidetes bacterium]|nr:hypothetical protein [Bacteroidota bacterium]